MTIGLDLSVLQSPHRMRGIGAVAINFVNNLPEQLKNQTTFVFYLFEKDQAKALSLLNLEGLRYEIRNLHEPKSSNFKLPKGSNLFNTFINAGRRKIHGWLGDPRISDLAGLDAFLQFDQMQSLPRSHKVKKGLVLYDLIPYILEADYLWSYKTARQHQKSRKGSLRLALLRRQYLAKLKANTRRADVLFAISNHTKQDFIRVLGTKPGKIKVTQLGINPPVRSDNDEVSFERYETTSWGFFPKPVNLADKPFLLFVGGADPRRKLIHLVAAYNHLKAQGYDLRLVLAGDIMKGPSAIPVPDVQKYLASSSYTDDMVFLGFVTEAQKEWLYTKALAMVYPSVYEGFGLPVLEAMKYGTPVITYDNTSIHEVAGNAALYAHDALSIVATVKELLAEPSLRQKYEKLGLARSRQFSWRSTVQQILDGF